MTDTSEIRDVALVDALGERYLSYALSTIMARSLPDVRDGLKPVHRRLLFAMRQLRLDPNTSPKKSARVVGDVIGKFHPHGDQSVYDALVRLAQDFAARYPLVDGQGNFGNVDGDGAAAMRYTEARLTEVAQALLAGIDEDAVDFRPTYDGEGEEPVVLPARFPNLLANGSAGIAVGMATSIPPHNAGELCGALLALIDDPKATPDSLLAHVRGPDFPTGGVLVESAEAIRLAYETGRGSFRVRARWEAERLSHGLYQIVVTEIPYQVAKSRLVERIANLLSEKKLLLLADVRDESTEDIRLVLEPKSRTVDPQMLMESLFRATELEQRISLNMNVLDAQGVPRVMSLKEVLQAFLDHRKVVLERRSRHRLGEVARRLEVLEGYLIAFLNIDEVIRIIREEDEPKAVMIARWSLTDVQVEAILNLRLRALRRLEEIEIRRERDKLAAEQAGLQGLLDSERKQWRAIAKEIKEIGDQFGDANPLGRRRTTIGAAPLAVEVPMEAMVEREPITILLSEKGWIRAARGHVEADADLRFKDGDRGRFLVHAETTDRLLLFSTNGRFYTLAADKLPRGRGFGEPIRLMIDLPNDHDVVTLFPHRPGRTLLVATSDGRGFLVAEDETLAQTRTGRQVLNVAGAVEAKVCIPAVGDHVAVVGDNRRLLVFKLDEVPTLARGRGVILQRYKDGGLSDIKVFAKADGLTWKIGERTRTETDLDPWLGARATAGRLPPNGFPKNQKFG
ncbi:DNA topoisomerase IV subunit A [Stella humosa]|uniref:DNA topoisomerase 4 subunit A n=1 Tax=Stella humosa TaxID=94 RepID=A0A3N1KSG9_9PROT|nr:DNA topoisomerase IV subunit A [Stella humosa]ROP81228.1 DNA topoisomerase IV subunit A [Stella humosa]BBK32576.1 DNA topoisomerase 4 subunit A [Stella humosa]